MSEFTKVSLRGTVSYSRESFPFIYMPNGVSRPEYISLMSLLKKTRAITKADYICGAHRFTMTILALLWNCSEYIFNMM